MAVIRLGMAQINATVGDFAGNRQKIAGYIDSARVMGCDIVTFPELAVTGYPPEDLLFKPTFIRENKSVLDSLVPMTTGITAVIGFVDSKGLSLYNSAAVVSDGQVVFVYHKIILPNYGVFDEQRYFKPGSQCPVVTINGVKTGISICEDIWSDAGPAECQALAGVQILINISSSPFHAGKWKERETMLASKASRYRVYVAYNNLVGGQDELVFDGGSMVLDYQGQPLVRAPQFTEEIVAVDIDTAKLPGNGAGNEPAPIPDGKIAAAWSSPQYTISTGPEGSKPAITPRITEPLEAADEVLKALTLGTRDYVQKNGFEHVVIGVSGGIDSGLVATLAVDALGPQKVTGVAMPSRYSSSASLEDARLLCKNLGIECLTIPIDAVYRAYLETLAEAFERLSEDITEENIQARIRGNLLMALSNKFGWLVLATGNKSEMATGYTTLYGDMAGGFAVIKDVPKTLVYTLSLYRNSRSNPGPIPDQILKKAPSAELRPNQKDVDSLPPYEVLDPILTAYVEQDKGVAEIINMGFDAATVRHAVRLVDISEYKRRQAPPGVKITPRSFGRDRRLPITNRFRGV